MGPYKIVEIYFGIIILVEIYRIRKIFLQKYISIDFIFEEIYFGRIIVVEIYFCRNIIWQKYILLEFMWQKYVFA